ncbi:hypothetical protein [Clostridium grantii]|uniref:Uncharacterized protein n=1 Tax=Clostridium grantii DSM 8605 TaxID=1121316 RepID=A0A1M5SN31_9CLOT|nr:hypothetical protein [Clostridium grantii]SHH39884.1 hypothetical protein SAMN02745207_01029 [Clostridium grantii DSM 8605]
MSDKDKKNEHSGFIDSVIGATTTENVGRYGRASAEYIKGYNGTISNEGDIIKKGLKQVAESKVNPNFEYQNLKQQAGFAAEINYVDKINADNIINRTNIRVSRSNDVGLGNHTQFDILAVDIEGNPILNSDQPLWSAQMKFCGGYQTQEQIQNSSEKLVGKLASEEWDRYRGNKVLVPSEQCELAKKYAQEESEKLLSKANEFHANGNIEKAKILEDKAQKYSQAAKDITDSGITSQEAMFLRENPKLATAKYVAKTAHHSGVEQAKAAAVMSSAISTSRNIVCIMRGEKEVKDALKDVAVDTAAGSSTAYIIGASDTAIRGFMASSKNSVFVNLSKTNLPATIATVGVQVGKSLIRYANGEIDGVQLVEELGEKGTGMFAASWGAAIGTAIFPGVGTAIGGMIGYMTSSAIYGTSMRVLKEEHLSAERTEKIHAITLAAIESMNAQRNELIVSINKFYTNRKRVFKESFDAIDLAIESNDLDKFTEGLNNITLEMGKILQFKNFDEFNNFMLDKNMVLEF